MEIDKELAKDLKVDFKIVGGKVLLTVEWDGADAAIDAIKPSLPAWLAPFLDLAKKGIDQL